MLVLPFRGKRIDTSNIKLQYTCFMSLFMCVGLSFIRGTFRLPSAKLFLCGFAAKLIIRNTLTVSSPESTDDLYSNCLSFSCRKLAKQAVLENGHDNLIEMDVFPPVCHEGGYGDGYVLLSLLMVPAADAKPNTEPTKVLNLQTPHPIPDPPKQKASAEPTKWPESYIEPTEFRQSSHALAQPPILYLFPCWVSQWMQIIKRHLIGSHFWHWYLLRNNCSKLSCNKNPLIC